jgi:hypothetical protein
VYVNLSNLSQSALDVNVRTRGADEHVNLFFVSVFYFYVNLLQKSVYRNILILTFLSCLTGGCTFLLGGVQFLGGWGGGMGGGWAPHEPPENPTLPSKSAIL